MQPREAVWQPVLLTKQSYKFPLSLKIYYTLFVLILIPAYWQYYGPENFLWFSDIALFVTGIALWTESKFLASMQAVSVVLLELCWIVGFMTGLSSYMFDSEIPIFIRALSLFHLWLPFLLTWMVWRLGYDKSAWIVQSVVTAIILFTCYFFTNPADNINWVFGLGQRPQIWLAPDLYLMVLMVLFPLVVYFPSHLLFSYLCSFRRGTLPS